MTSKSMELLLKLQKVHRETGRSRFDSVFYADYPDDCLHELEVYGHITCSDDMIGSVTLLDF